MDIERLGAIKNGVIGLTEYRGICEVVVCGYDIESIWEAYRRFGTHIFAHFLL
ncbi:unnamed protein product [Meloidogyne enterolobii]|uniref:Uncharacterized protein n=1 Tax=Meloidogyne enterolobii TaxID=390850 RepID=A0ACB1AC78_MELEN